MTEIIGPPDNLLGVVWVRGDSSNYTMEYLAVVGVIPMTRRALVEGFRKLADAWEAEAEKVGD